MDWPVIWCLWWLRPCGIFCGNGQAKAQRSQYHSPTEKTKSIFLAQRFPTVTANNQDFSQIYTWNLRPQAEEPEVWLGLSHQQRTSQKQKSATDKMKVKGIGALHCYVVKPRLGIRSGSQSQNMDSRVSEPDKTRMTSSFTTWTNDLRQFLFLLWASIFLSAR